MDTFESWKAEASRLRTFEDVCFDRALLFELEQAEADAKKEPGMLDSGGPPVQELRDEIKAKTRRFVFESIGKRAWRDLLAEHPPTKEQRASLGMALDHNPDTFPPAAMAATCVEPGMTAEQAQWFYDEFPIGVVERVWNAVLLANVIGGDEKKVVSAPLQAGEKRSKPQPSSESLAQSS